MNVRVLIRTVGILLVTLPLLGKSAMPPADKLEQVRAYTRNIEFDYAGWMLDAALLKGAQAALGTARYLPADTQKLIVLSYLDLQRRIFELEAQIELIYANPDIVDPEYTAEGQTHELATLLVERQRLGSLSETVIQGQISDLLEELDLGLGGQPVPPVLYHITPMPQALIVSPRTIIRQDADVSLLPEVTLQEIIILEQQVESGLDVSVLVEPVGGVGVYPTMVMSTTNLSSLLEIVAHEWTHNFLTLRPLGVNYYTTPELRTMNETAASMSGKEISRAVMERYYPEYLPAPAPPPQPQTEAEAPQPIDPPVFDFRNEMHITRVTVDAMLAEGKVGDAEEYMEERRRYLWENGYHIRRLNQAYFAFHGAYADTPAGAAGEDPVGPAVRALREQCGSLSRFLNRISWMTSFDALQKAVEHGD